jgi:hypothetical protein
MTNQDNLSPETLAGSPQLSAADGGETVASPALSLSDLNSHLGSDFKDVSTALKALKDTQSYVGKKKEDIAAELRSTVNASLAPQVDAQLRSELQSIKDELFYSAHPEYKGYRGLISKMGSSPSEVTGSEEFKSVFEKVKIADEQSTNRSVIHSNQRLGQAQTATDEAIQIANARGKTTADVAQSLTRAIMAEMEN